MIIRRRHIPKQNIIALRGDLGDIEDACLAQRDLDNLRAILRRRVFEGQSRSTVGIGFLTEVEAAEFLRLVGTIRRFRRRAK